MSRRWFLVAALVVVVALVAGGAVGGVVWSARPKTNAVVIKVSGTSGLALEGTAEVDGSPRELTGTVPTEFHLEGRRVTYSLKTPEDAGEFRVHVTLGDVTLGSAGSTNPPVYGIRGWVQSDWGWSPRPRNWIENFNKAEEKGWLTPPP
jgi:hypothetical protein